MIASVELKNQIGTEINWKIPAKNNDRILTRVSGIVLDYVKPFKANKGSVDVAVLEVNDSAITADRLAIRNMKTRGRRISFLHQGISELKTRYLMAKGEFFHADRDYQTSITLLGRIISGLSGNQRISRRLANGFEDPSESRVTRSCI